MLFALAMVIDQNTSSEMSEEGNPYTEAKLPELKYYNEYETLRADDNTVVVYPIFTQTSYDWNGIRDFYAGYCNTCLSAKIPDSYKKSLAASGDGFRILEFLGYQIIDDIDIDKNPEILKKYDKVILLHNEYVTKNEFEAITNHPNVIYLYPNALSSEVHADYTQNEITLVRGPGYPYPDIKNGFDWVHDNSQYFKDWKCNSWEFYKTSNGFMLNCYPEMFLPNNGYELLKVLKEL
jgi:hypothetical protein